MIKPTIGRVVLYHDPLMSDQPMPAIVCYVWSDHCVNLAIFDGNGGATGKTSVSLVQPESERPASPHATWMPYQIKKDYGSESGERAVGEQKI